MFRRNAIWEADNEDMQYFIRDLETDKEEIRCVLHRPYKENGKGIAVWQQKKKLCKSERKT